MNSTGRTGSQPARLAVLLAHDIAIAAKAAFRTNGLICFSPCRISNAAALCRLASAHLDSDARGHLLWSISHRNPKRNSMSRDEARHPLLSAKARERPRQAFLALGRSRPALLIPVL